MGCFGGCEARAGRMWVEEIGLTVSRLTDEMSDLGIVREMIGRLM